MAQVDGINFQLAGANVSVRPSGDGSNNVVVTNGTFAPVTMDFIRFQSIIVDQVNSGKLDESVGVKVLKDVQEAVNKSKQEKEEQDKETAETKKKECGCPKCLEKYKQAVNSLVGNINKVLQNKTIQIQGCPTLNGKGDEPGCLNAPYKSGKNQEKTNADVGLTQPNNNDTLAQNSDQTKLKEDLMREFRDLLEISDEKLGSAPGVGDKPAAIDSGFGFRYDPVNKRKIWSTTEGSFSFNSLGRDGKVVVVKSNKQNSGCKGLLNLWAQNQKDGNPTAAFSDDFVKLGNLNASLNKELTNLLNWCCKVQARELFDEQGDLGELGELSTYQPKLGYGAASAPCTYGSHMNLQQSLTCCTDGLTCPKIECEQTPSEIQASVKKITDSLSKVSDRKGSPSCLNGLVDELQKILYGEGGLYSKLMRYMIIDSIWGDKFSSAGAGDNPLNRMFKPWTGEKGSEGSPPCSDQIMGPLQKGDPTGSTHPWNDHGIVINDPVLMNTHTELLEAYSFRTIGDKCKIPITIDIPITSITIGDGKELLSIKYNELINKLQKQLRDSVTKLLQGIDIPESTTPEADKQRCDEIKKILEDNKQQQERLKKEIANINSELDKTLPEKMKKLDDEIAKARSSRTFPTLPGEKPTDSTKCKELRFDYQLELGRNNGIESSLNTARQSVESKSISISLSKAKLRNYYDTIVQINGLAASVQREQSGTAASKLGLDPTLTYAQLKTKVQGLIPPLETQIRSYETQLSDLKSTVELIEKDLAKSSKKLAQLGEQVAKECKLDNSSFDPPTEKETDDGGRLNSLLKAKESLQETIDKLIENRTSKQNELSILNVMIPAQQQEYDLICGQGAVTADKCFYTCIRNKVEKLIDSISVLSLKSWNNNPTPCVEGELAEDPDRGLPDPSPDGKQGDWIFNDDITPGKFAAELQKIILDCLTAVPDADKQKEKPAYCAFAEQRKKVLNDEIIKLEKEIRKPDAADFLGMLNGENEDLGLGTDKNTQDLFSIIISILERMKVQKSSVPSDADMTSINDYIEKICKENPNANMAKKTILRNRIFGIITIYRSDEDKILTLQKSIELLDRTIRACNAIETNKNKCQDLLSVIAPQIADKLEAANFDTIWNDFIDLAKSLYDPNGPGAGTDGTGPNMTELKNQIRQYIDNWVSKLCPDMRTIDKANWPGGPTDDPNLYTGPYKDGVPTPGAFTPGQAYQPIENQHISIICTNGRWKIIRVLVYLNTQAYWDKNNPMNAFWNKINDILNATVLCKSKDCDGRKSILHDWFLRAVEGYSSLPTIQDPLKSGPNKVGPRWEPLTRDKFGDPNCLEGPYYFPPHNDYQAKAAVDGQRDKLDPPCPQHCTQLPHPPAPKNRFSMLRRVYFELSSALEYFMNVERLVESTKDSIDSFTKGLEFCANINNSPKEYTQTPEGQASILNPENHEDPKDPTAALVKAAMNSKCPCKDLITGDPVNGGEGEGNNQQEEQQKQNEASAENIDQQIKDLEDLISRTEANLQKLKSSGQPLTPMQQEFIETEERRIAEYREDLARLKKSKLEST